MLLFKVSVFPLSDTTCAALVERGAVPLLVGLAKMEEPEQVRSSIGGDACSFTILQCLLVFFFSSHVAICSR